MIEINSRNNEKIKNIIKLKQKKYRDASGFFLVEGIKVLKEAIKSDYMVENIIVTKNAFDKYKEFLQEFNNKIIKISSNIVNDLKASVTSPEIFAVVKKVEKKLDNSNFIILDNIQDPQNLGAIFRICAATGFKNVLLLNCVDSFSEKTIRASMGNIFKLNLKNCTLDELKMYCKNKEVYSADLNGENIFKIQKPSFQFGVIFGNEGNGVSDEVNKLATKFITIPMKNGVESLNVSVSAGIILFNLTN